MSQNQSRAERSDSAQYGKTGRSGSSNQQRQFSGGASTKGGGGASFAPTNPSNRSFKKYNNNAPVTQPGAGAWNVDSSDSSAVHAVKNGAHQQQPTQRVPEAPGSKISSNLKPTNASTLKTNRPVPKSPASNIPSAAASSNVTNASSDSKAPVTPGKTSGDASKSYPLQFGSISPGFMNGMQIPARTNSAPPNLDEQKKEQARYESSRTAPALPNPSVPKQHLPKKDAGILDQPNSGEAHLVSKPKRDAQISTAQPGIQAQKPTLHPIPNMATTTISPTADACSIRWSKFTNAVSSLVRNITAYANSNVPTPRKSTSAAFDVCSTSPATSHAVSRNDASGTGIKFLPKYGSSAISSIG